MDNGSAEVANGSTLKSGYCNKIQQPDLHHIQTFLYFLLLTEVQRIPEHLSVYETSPELWEREAFEEKLNGAPEATGEPGKSSTGELCRLAVRAFFSAGAGLLA